MVFADRTAAGHALAERLTQETWEDPAILALPRGGVPIAAVIARALAAPLDLVMVRKVGVPWHRELAAGAVADGPDPELVINDDIIRHVGLDRAAIDDLAAEQIREIQRRRQVYLGGRAPVPLAGRCAIVVDDGIATGATTRAALRAVRRQNPARLVLTVPVAPQDALEDLRAEVDAIICLQVPRSFGAISSFYRDFRQVTDAEVVQLLGAAREDRAAAPQTP